jgi:rRNA maturation endonuclease Nob1
MQARQVAVKPWHKTCSRCKKPVFQDLLDEQGLCEYCRAIVAMKTSSRKKRGQTPSH